jgi:hypothetical protein
MRVVLRGLAVAEMRGVPLAICLPPKSCDVLAQVGKFLV